LLQIGSLGNGNRFVFSREFTSKGQTMPGTIYQETGIPEGALKKGEGRKNNEPG